MQSKCHLTWNINYFLVHIQESVLCLFTSLTQRINLQQRMREGGKKEWLIVSYTTSQLNVTSKHSKARPINSTVRRVYIQYLSILTMYRYVPCNHSCFDRGCVGVSFPWSQFSCSTDDGCISFVACPCMSVSVCPQVSVSKSISRLMCAPVCKRVCSFPLQHTDIIKQLAQSFQPQQGKIIQSALSSNTVWIHY